MWNLETTVEKPNLIWKCRLQNDDGPVSFGQAISLWQVVGQQRERRVGNKPVWLSTAGGGVAWLHARLDDRPKYYSYQPYREEKQSP